jgi:hypothetical protein
LIHGSEAVAKDVLEYCVFEKHLSNVYGTWRLHAKIIPDWMPRRFAAFFPSDILFTSLLSLVGNTFLQIDVEKFIPDWMPRRCAAFFPIVLFTFLLSLVGNIFLYQSTSINLFEFTESLLFVASILVS